MLPNVKDSELLKKSVTSGDFTQYERDGVVNLMIPFAGWGVDRINLPPRLPAYWSWTRDDVLRATVFREGFWSAAVGIAISKVAAKGFEVSGEGGRRREHARDLILYADGRQAGWTQFVSKHLRDFLLTDNGAFVEIIRARKGWGAKIIGIRHLDSRRCTRTGDPETPVLYRDRRGYQHELKFHQVMTFSDLPDGGETYYGTGLSAASRAYTQIYKLAGLEWYMNEKVRGTQPLAIHVVNGLLDKQVKGAVESAKNQAISTGVTSHMGAVIIAIPSQNSPGLVTIPLAELPDGFNRKEEFDIAVLTYANALGLDPQELQPLSSSNLGTSAQSQVLHQKAKGRGLVTWTGDWIHKINEWVMPDKITFAFSEDDLDDENKKATNQKARTDVAAARVQAGFTTADQERQLLADAGDIPKEYLEQDITPAGSLDDDEKEPEDKTGGPAAEKPEPPQPTKPEGAASEAPRAGASERTTDDTTKEAGEFEEDLKGIAPLTRAIEAAKRIFGRLPGNKEDTYV